VCRGFSSALHSTGFAPSEHPIGTCPAETETNCMPKSLVLYATADPSSAGSSAQADIAKVHAPIASVTAKTLVRLPPRV
jgi:hypothetical protein